MAVTARPASAHIAIRLDFRSPQAGARIGPNSEAVIFAQPTLAGVSQVAFAATLDRQPIDPISGRLLAQEHPTVIHAGSEVRIPLRRLHAGPHRVDITYRPDVDEPITRNTVEFTVRAPESSRAEIVLIIAVLVAMAAVASALLIRRSHGQERGLSSQGANASIPR